MPDDDETVEQESEEAEAPPKPEPVEEEVENQEPPANLTQKGLDEINQWRQKVDADLRGFTDWRTGLEQHEHEEAEHRKTIESKETNDDVHKKEGQSGEGPKGSGEEREPRRGSKRIHIFRRRAGSS